MWGAGVRSRQVRVLIDLASGSVPDCAALIEPVYLTRVVQKVT